MYVCVMCVSCVRVCRLLLYFIRASEHFISSPPSVRNKTCDIIMAEDKYKTVQPFSIVMPGPHADEETGFLVPRVASPEDRMALNAQEHSQMIDDKLRRAEIYDG